MSEIIYIIAGEKSGDLHGGELMAELKKSAEHYMFKGVGGESMLQEGLLSTFPLSDFQVMGFTDVLLNFPRLYNRFYSLAAKILTENPPAVIFIDYPGFNLRLAKHLRKKGYTGKLIHYIAPTVWAWGKKRAEAMSKTLDLLLTIYPYESHFFKETLKVKFVGHPLATALAKREKPNRSQNAPLLALFPGSRRGEIQRNLEAMLKAAKIVLAKHKEMTLAISCGDLEETGFIEKELLKSGLKGKIIPYDQRYELMEKASVAIAKSGTVTLELALLECPVVVVYRLSKLNYFLAKHIFKIDIPHIAIPNLLLNETLFPEIVGKEINAERVAEAALLQMERKEEMKKKAKRLQEMLEKETEEEAALAILELLDGR